jgi:hypothetical protein
MYAPPVSGVGEVGTYIAHPQLALRPLIARDGQVEAWQARADLPWHGWEPGNTPLDVAMASLNESPVSSQAICGALRGAFRLGVANGADPEELKRLSAICDACNGYPWEEIAEAYGAEHANAAAAVVGSFFGKAFRAIKKVAKKAISPIANAALSFVPGGGLVKQAFDMASPLLKKSISKGHHLPPQQRAPVAPGASPRAPGSPLHPGAPGGFGGGCALPWPYPLPYPVPGWGGGQPGAAWPPR